MGINKKILASVFIIGLLAFGLGYGTYSYFHDTETSTGNVFTAGTIDISIDPTGGQDVVTVDGDVELKPSQIGYTTTVIKNVGTNPCEVWKHITNVDNREHGITEPEQEYYDKHAGSADWLISDWMRYDMIVYKPLEYSFTGESVTYSFYKPNGINVSITVEIIGCKVKWTFDFPIDADPGNGNMGYALVISFDKATPKFQVHNNDGTDSNYPWGTHLYSEWGPAGTGYNGWHTGDTNTPVSDIDWIEASGHRYHQGKTDDPTPNEEGIFTVTIDLCKLPETIYWAAHFGAGGFYDYGGLSKYPEAWTPWSGDASAFETASIKTLIKEIPEAHGWFLSWKGPVVHPNNNNYGVESKWIYLGTLEPGKCMCVIQSYHLDKDVDNWGQSDRVFFDIEFLAQQIEGAMPPEPSPVLPGHGRP